MSVGAAILQQALGAALTTGLDAVGSVLNIIPQGSINDIAIQATLEETNTDTLVVTEHPVQTGAQITDHSYVRLPEVRLRCGWSNSGQGVVSSINSTVNAVSTAYQSYTSGGALQSAASLESATIVGGQISTGDYVGGIYSKLVALQQSGQVFDIQTSLRLYNNMVLTSIVLTRDQKTSQALMVTATCRQILIVNVTTAQLAPTAVQANPASSAENVSVGPQTPTLGTPSQSGGALPPSSWAPTIAGAT